MASRDPNPTTVDQGALDALVKSTENEFGRRFGRPPVWTVAAPGRVNLIGEHTDYNGGFVLPMAIDRYVVVAADLAGSPTGPEARVYSAVLDRWATLSVGGAVSPRPGAWSSYVEGVLVGCQSAGLTPPPFEAVIGSDLPMGGGLSSSAALEVALATLVEGLTGRRLEPLQKALLCQKAENEYAGVPCGVMDQCSSVMGRDGELLLLDCRTLTVEWTPLADPDVLVLIVNSNVERDLGTVEYAVRRRQCEEAARLLGVVALRDVSPAQLEARRDRLSDVLYRRARHVVTENDRTVEAAGAVRRGDWEAVGKLMFASHASLRDDFEVSCRELDILVDLAAGIGAAGGVIGSRMTGGGFGGCTVSLVRRQPIEDVIARITAHYQEQTGRRATAFATRPVAGARVIRVATQTRTNGGA
jgi:galactokinase